MISTINDIYNMKHLNVEVRLKLIKQLIKSNPENFKCEFEMTAANAFIELLEKEEVCIMKVGAYIVREEEYEGASHWLIFIISLIITGILHKSGVLY